jgi:putative tryptophan/tyrosine transport system substrate-binding protein
VKRRDVVLLGALAFGCPGALAQSGRMPRVGYLFSFPRAEGEHLWQACRAGLRELGYVEGKNILVEPRWADGDYSRLPALVQELLQLKVDVLVTAATPPSRAAMAATKTTPIVFVAVGEPIAVGLVKTMARPGGNITGLSLLTSELSGRRLKLLVDCVGKVQTVAVIKNPANRVHESFLAESRAAAGALGVQLTPLDAAGPDDIERAFDAARVMKADAALVFDDPVLWSHRKRFVALAGKSRLPVMYGYREFVEEGGLISLGPDRIDHYRRTAIYVDRILKGAKPAELPVEQPVKFQLVINLKSASALGLKVPERLLLAADEVIK